MRAKTQGAFFGGIVFVEGVESAKRFLACSKNHDKILPVKRGKNNALILPLHQTT